MLAWSGSTITFRSFRHRQSGAAKCGKLDTRFPPRRHRPGHLDGDSVRRAVAGVVLAGSWLGTSGSLLLAVPANCSHANIGRQWSLTKGLSRIARSIGKGVAALRLQSGERLRLALHSRTGRESPERGL